MPREQQENSDQPAVARVTSTPHRTTSKLRGGLGGLLLPKVSFTFSLASTTRSVGAEFPLVSHQRATFCLSGRFLSLELQRLFVSKYVMLPA